MEATSSRRWLRRTLALGFCTLAFTFFYQLLHSQTAPALEQLLTRTFFAERLVPLGGRPPTEIENRLLLDILDDFSASRGRVGLADLEEYLKRYPESAWAIALHANLAEHSENRGRVTAALEHWEKAWGATAAAAEAPASEIADRVLAHWSRQLLCLNRLDEVGTLIQLHAGRRFGPGPACQIWLQVVEAYTAAMREPERSARCGLYVLDQLALAVNGEVPYRAELWDTETPTEGVSLEELAKLGNRQGLLLTPVFREGGEAVVVPSIVHLRQGHYAAILAQRGDGYLVRDPAAMTQRELTAEDINAEATGFFLVPGLSLPVGWRLATAIEARAVMGTVIVALDWRFNDVPPCEECSCPPGRSPGPRGPRKPGLPEEGGTPGWPEPDPGVPHALCPGCGMPQWFVSEPYLNLWVKDIPYWYQPSKGPAIELRLFWRQRNGTTLGAGETRFGDGWACHWQSKVVHSAKALYLPGGGILQYTFPTGSEISDPHYRDNSRLQRIVQSGQTAGYVVHYRDGSKWYYTQLNGTDEWWLKEQGDAQGLKLTFGYDGSIPSKLRTVTDADGLVTTLNYGLGNQYVTSITGPGNRQVSFSQSGGYLTGLTDTVGIQSSFSYDPSTRWLTSITTPYGQTSFEMPSAPPTYDRAVRITHPDASQYEVFVYGEDGKLLVRWADRSGKGSFLERTFVGGDGSHRMEVWYHESWCSVVERNKEYGLMEAGEWYRLRFTNDVWTAVR